MPSPKKVRPTFATRLVWVRQPGKELPKSLNLLNRFSAEGIDIWVIEASNLANLVIEDLTDFDLILFEYFDHVANEMKAVVNRIRLDSRAPLMMLTDDHSVACSLDILRAGADAIFTISTPDEVILARCNALLRRWLTNV
jgi:DNA-binding response OmpR family regulator